MNRKGIIYSALIFIIGLIIGFTFRSVISGYVENKQIKADSDGGITCSGGDGSALNFIQDNIFLMEKAQAAGGTGGGNICVNTFLTTENGDFINLQYTNPFTYSFSLATAAISDSGTPTCDGVNTASGTTANEKTASRYSFDNLSLNAKGDTNYCVNAAISSPIISQTNEIPTKNYQCQESKPVLVKLKPTNPYGTATIKLQCSSL